jgi:hypothetical protein
MGIPTLNDLVQPTGNLVQDSEEIFCLYLHNLNEISRQVFTSWYYLATVHLSVCQVCTWQLSTNVVYGHLCLKTGNETRYSGIVSIAWSFIAHTSFDKKKYDRLIWTMKTQYITFKNIHKIILVNILPF